MDQRIIELYDEYTHAPLPRRVFIKRLTTFAGSSAGAMAVLPLLESNYAHAAAVPFYGIQPAAADVPKIKARLLLHYAGTDERINAGIPAFEATLKSAGVSYTMHRYEGTRHAFHNDTAGAPYNKEAAALAWRRTIEFLQTALKS